MVKYEVEKHLVINDEWKKLCMSQNQAKSFSKVLQQIWVVETSLNDLCKTLKNTSRHGEYFSLNKPLYTLIFYNSI